MSTTTSSDNKINEKSFFVQTDLKEPKSLIDIASNAINTAYNVKARRDLHRIPEVMFKEYKTAAYIAKQLRSFPGFQVYEECGVTGVVGVLTGEYTPEFDISTQSGYCLAIRADMDALTITEKDSEFNQEYKSTIPGMHHACGHDGHMSIALTTAKLLSEIRHQIRKDTQIKFIFQPAEEGGGGAPKMIADGVLEEGKFGPYVNEIYGLHLWNYEPVGTVCWKVGPMMASSDKFEILIKGQGGHGAVPNGTTDCINAAAHLVTQLHSIVSRNISPLDSAVVSLCTFTGGYAYNIIPDDVKLTGTVRTLRKSDQETVIQRMNALCDGVSTSFGVDVKLNYEYGYPATVNDKPDNVEYLKKAAIEIVGIQNLNEIRATMCAEDMSYFLQARPGCFYFLGSSPKDLFKQPNVEFPHHKSNFDIDERCLPVGTAVWLNLVRHRLQNVSISEYGPQGMRWFSSSQ